MSEPVTATGAAGGALVVIVSAVIGEQLGPIVTVCGAAAIGALVSLGEVETSSRAEAVVYVARYVAMAAAVSGTIAFLIERFTTIPAIEVLAGVAFGVGWVGNRWGGVRTAAVETVKSLIALFGKKGA